MDKHIKVNLDDEIIARLEYHDGDGVDWEEYIDPETGKKYSVQIEVVRHWYKAEEIVEMTKEEEIEHWKNRVQEESDERRLIAKLYDKLMNELKTNKKEYVNDILKKYPKDAIYLTKRELEAIKLMGDKTNIEEDRV